MSQPHYPPQHPQPQYPQPQWAPPPAKKGLATPVKVLIGVGALVLVSAVAVVAVLALSKPAKEATKLNVGDCVQLTGSGDEADAVKTACDSSPHMVSIAGVDKGEWGCSKGFYRVAIPSQKKNVALCLALNAKEGDCFTDIDSKTPPSLVDCSQARVKVTKVLPGLSATGQECGDEATRRVSYTSGMDARFKPPGTICFADAS